VTPSEQVSLRDFVEAIIREQDRRHNELRKADLASLEQYKKEAQRALEIAKSNLDRTISLLLGGLALMISITTAIFVYFK
jgi:hypothetical protein